MEEKPPRRRAPHRVGPTHFQYSPDFTKENAKHVIRYGRGWWWKFYPDRVELYTCGQAGNAGMFLGTAALHHNGETPHYIVYPRLCGDTRRVVVGGTLKEALAVLALLAHEEDGHPEWRSLRDAHRMQRFRVFHPSVTLSLMVDAGEHSHGR